MHSVRAGREVIDVIDDMQAIRDFETGLSLILLSSGLSPSARLTVVVASLHRLTSALGMSRETVVQMIDAGYVAAEALAKEAS